MADKYIYTRQCFYQAIVAHDPSQSKFLSGWLRRLNCVKEYVDGVKTLAQVKAEW
jgi:hypothetical protein